MRKRGRAKVRVSVTVRVRVSVRVGSDTKWLGSWAVEMVHVKK